MLLNITLENFRSYNEEQTLSLLASDDNSDINSIKIAGFNIRKSAVIYGANASGKSSLVRALTVLTEILRNSISSEFIRTIFQNNGCSFFYNNNPSKINIDFENDSNIYTYVIWFNKEEICYEGLLDSNENIIYERTYNVDKDVYKINKPEFLLSDEQLKAKDSILAFWQGITDRTQLFMSQAAKNNCNSLKKISDFLTGIIIRNNPYMPYIQSVNNLDAAFALNYYKKNQNLEEITNVLNSVGTQISSLEIKDENIMVNGIAKTGRGVSSHYILNNSSNVSLNFLLEESDGTIKMFNYFALIKHLTINGGVIVVDELESHLHPLLVEEIVRAVHNSDSKVQLIFTTHNPILLNESIFERDQIYFAEKNENKATELYSLIDFNDLKDDDNIQRKYLSGNFGAIPYLHSIDIDRK